jgi:hypothetical protein
LVVDTRVSVTRRRLSSPPRNAGATAPGSRRRDGHHRVPVARARGAVTINAVVAPDRERQRLVIDGGLVKTM